MTNSIPTTQGDLASLTSLLHALKIPADLPRYDAIAQASQSIPTTSAGEGTSLPDLAALKNLKHLAPDILSKLKEAGIDESDSRYSELTAQFESLDSEGYNEFQWHVPLEDVEANRALRAKLDIWMSRVEERLRRLVQVVKRLHEKGWRDEEDQREDAHKDLEIQAQIIFIVAPFVLEAEDQHHWQRWMSPATNAFANEILSTFLVASSTLPLPLLEVLLTHNIKSIFQHNIHPKLNPATGRELPRLAGGPLASQDFYDSQRWKEYPGMGNILFWCLKHIDTTYYEKIWHLLIPPIMTMLDDYEAKYKLAGIQVTREMLKTVPGYLLKRTGVEGLIRAALTTSLTNLQSPESPHLVRSAIQAQVELTLLTALPSEKAYFDQLSDLLGQGIIGGVWFYGYDNQGVILASVEALPRVIKAFGIGSVRFLKVLVTQLIDPLLPKPLRHVSIQLQVASMEALWVVMEECKPRMDIRYAGIVVDAVARCWVTLNAVTNRVPKSSLAVRSTAEETRIIKLKLRETCERLKNVCPSVMEEYNLMLQAAGELRELYQ